MSSLRSVGKRPWPLGAGRLFLAMIACVLAVAGAVSLFSGVETTLEVALPSVGPERGHAYLARLPRDVDAPADSAQHPEESRLQLFENGVALGPAHSLHEDIRKLGGGRYSHWSFYIYFSTSDNSNPGTNGRRYAVRFGQRQPPRWMSVLALGVGLAMLAFASRSILGGLLPERLRIRAELRRPAALATAGTLGIALSATLLIGLDPPTTGAQAPPGFSSPIEQRLTGWDDPAAKRRVGETDREFVTRMTRTVFERVYHCDYHATPRVIDWIASRILDDQFNDVGNLTPGALRCGWCNQVSYVLARILSDAGISADLLVLNGHVVTLAQFDGKQWIADADFGVGPHEYPVSFSSVEPFYRKIIGKDESWMGQLAAAYATTRDDTPYFRSMDWLNDTERSQRIIIRSLEVSAWVLGAFGVVAFVTGIRRWRIASAQRVQEH